MLAFTDLGAGIDSRQVAANPTTPAPTAGFVCQKDGNGLTALCVAKDPGTLSQFNALQTLINKAALQALQTANLVKVNSQIDYNTVSAMLALSKAVGGQLAIFDARGFDAGYVANNVATFITAYQSYLGVNPMVSKLRAQFSTAVKMASGVQPTSGNPNNTINPGTGPSQNPPTFQCADGTVVQNSSQCASMTSQGYVCGSDGSVVNNPALCPPVGQSPTNNIYVCGDGSRVNDPSFCPSNNSGSLPMMYVCWNGSKVGDPANCPVAPNGQIDPGDMPAETKSAFPMKTKYLMIGALAVGVAAALLIKR